MSGRGGSARDPRKSSRLRGWIHRKKYLARGSAETNRVDEEGFSVNSHNNLAGGVLRVPLEDADAFHQHYMDDVREGQVFYYSENFTRVYRMCFDLDFKSEAPSSRGDEEEDDEVLGEMDMDSFEYRYRVYWELIKTVRRFYPVETKAEKFTAIILEAPSKTHGETTDHCAFTKTGVHLVFPYLYVSKTQALYMVEAAAVALEAEMGQRGQVKILEEDGSPKRYAWQNSWEDVCDKLVHLQGNLRLPYSDKPMKCKDCDSNPACKRGSKSLCGDPSCVYQRKPENRVYTPKMILKLNGNTDDVMLQTLLANPYRPIRMTSVRTSLTSTTPGFAPFEGCTMPPELVGGKVSKKPKKRKPKEATVHRGDKSYLEESDKRCKIMLDLVRKCDPHYAKALFQSCFYSDMASGARRYLFHIRGEGSNYCLNKADDHHSSTVYFVFSKAGIRQRCFCRKTVPRISGEPCSKYSSDLMVAPLDKLSILFPDIESEFTFKGIYKRTKRGKISKGGDDAVTFGCRRPKARSTASNAAKTMEDLSKALMDQAKKMERHAAAKEEKSRRSKHLSSGEAFKTKAMGKTPPPSTTSKSKTKGSSSTKSSKSGERDYSKVLSRAELMELDWYETKCYLEAQAAKALK